MVGMAMLGSLEPMEIIFNMTLLEMISLTDKRQPGFEYMIDYLRSIDDPLIIETGMVRDHSGCEWEVTVESSFRDDGMSTLIFDQYINEYNGEFHSVDIEQINVDYTKRLISNETVLHCGDSIGFLWDLKIELEKVNRSIDLLYLDSFENPVHHLKELCVIIPRLKPGALIAVDDNYGNSNDRGLLIHEMMDGIGIPLVHNGIQKIWKL